VHFIRKEEKRADGLRAPISPNQVRVSASEDGREITCALLSKNLDDDDEPNRALWTKRGPAAR
jgi:hypothetical protein